MKKKLVRKEVIINERFEMEFDVVCEGKQFAKMWALEQLSNWTKQTGRQIDRMPRVEQIEVEEILGVVYNGEDRRYQVKFSVKTRRYNSFSA
jgi:hypothetical protein